MTKLIYAKDLRPADILAGKQTMFRVLMRKQPPNEPLKQPHKRWGIVDGDLYYCGIKSPYRVGDVLGVREPWAFIDGKGYLYKSDPIFAGMEPGDFAWKWRHPLHIGKEAVQIWIEITGIKAEQVCRISGNDAFDEGFNYLGTDGELHNPGDHPSYTASAFQRHWSSLYPGTWEKWAWAFGVRRVER